MDVASRVALWREKISGFAWISISRWLQRLSSPLFMRSRRCCLSAREPSGSTASAASPSLLSRSFSLPLPSLHSRFQSFPAKRALLPLACVAHTEKHTNSEVMGISGRFLPLHHKIQEVALNKASKKGKETKDAVRHLRGPAGEKPYKRLSLRETSRPKTSSMMACRCWSFSRSLRS